MTSPILQKRFAVDVLKLTSGTVVAQAISILAAPALARLFSPAAFGTAALFTSIVGVLSIIVCLRYDRSIIVPSNDEDALALVAISSLIGAIITVISALMILCFGNTLLHRLNAPELRAYLWLVPVNVLLLGFTAALNSWNTRKRHFTLITIAQLGSSALYLGFSLIAGVTEHSSGGYLILGALLGQAISTVLLCLQMWREAWPDISQSVTPARVLSTVRRYQRFPKYGTGAGILNSVGWELPSFFLSAFFSQAVLGQYALGNRLIRIPMSLIGLNISRVFSQRAAEAKHELALAPLVMKTFRLLTDVGLFPFLLLMVAGKDLFSLVFGARWAEAGVYTQILSPWAFFWFASAPLSSVLDILDEQAFDLRMNALIVVSRLLSLIIGCYLGGPRTALIIFSASGVLVYGYYCVSILAKSEVPISSGLHALWTNCLLFIPFGSVLLGLKVLNASSLTVVLVSALLLIVYYLIAVHRNSDLREMIYAILSRRFPRTLLSDTDLARVNNSN